MLEKKIIPVDLKIKDSSIEEALMVAPTLVVFSETVPTLKAFINDNKIVINSDEVRVKDADDKYPEVASTYIQGKGYLSFSSNGAFFLRNKFNGTKTTIRLAHYTQEGELVIENQEVLDSLKATA